MLSVTFLFVSNNCHTLLFLFRVRALLHDARKVRAFFAVLWLAVLGCTTLEFQFIEPERSALDSKRCTFRRFNPAFAIIPVTMTLIFDTAVYLTISYRLFKIFQYEREGVRSGVRRKARVFFGGNNLPAFSKSLLHDGQIYYL